MPRNDIREPPEIIEKENFGRFCSQPCEGRAGWVAKCVINVGKRIQRKRFAANYGPFKYKL